MPMVLWWGERGLMFPNGAFAPWLGAVSHDDAGGSATAEAVERSEEFISLLDEMFQGRQSVAAIEIVRDSRGSAEEARHSSLNLTALRSRDGARVEAVLGVLTPSGSEMKDRRSSAALAEKLRRAIEIETVGIFFFSTSGAITDANEAFLRMSGYTREDVQNGLVRWDQMTPPEWMPESLKAMEQLKAVGRTIPYEQQFQRKDGTRCWGLFCARRLEENEGVNFIIDITRRKATDEELGRHRDDLEMCVQQRTAALDAANGALRDEIVERQRAEAARLELQRQLANAQEEAQRRISRELHDEVGQHLTALILGLKALESTNTLESARTTLASLQAITETVGKQIHDLALELRPTALDDLGLLRTLSNYIEQWSATSKIDVDFHSTGWSGERLPPAIETTIYRIVQEALTNILKHARASFVSLIVERRPEQVTVIIEDDGEGFTPETTSQYLKSKHLGLLGMEERATLMDGELKIESTPGEGTTVFVRIPLPFSRNASSHG